MANGSISISPESFPSGEVDRVRDSYRWRRLCEPHRELLDDALGLGPFANGVDQVREPVRATSEAEIILGPPEGPAIDCRGYDSISCE